MNRRRLMLAIFAPLLALVLVFTFWTLRPIPQEVSAELPHGFAQHGFDHSSFEQLLQQFVTKEGRIDYARFHADAVAREQLGRYLAAVAKFSPESSPERFETKDVRTVYWLSAYNAQVIGAVLKRWPLKSVTDVKAPMEVVRGLGFFYKLRFVFGGKLLSLYEVEHSYILNKAQDPRVHFVLNCGSGSCPVLRPKLPQGDALEPYLTEAARDFVTDDGNVHIEHERKEVVLSKIFEWYEDDFLDELSRRGLSRSGGVLGYVALIAPEKQARDLVKAKDYAVRYRDYDWSINAGAKK